MLEAGQASYTDTPAALKAHFDPTSSQSRFEAEFQACREKTSEGWADFAEDLTPLIDKAYLDLDYQAREYVAVDAFLTRFLSHRSRSA